MARSVLGVAGCKRTTRGPGQRPPGSPGWDRGLLQGVLLGLSLGVELRGVAVLDGDAERLLQESAGLAAVGAGVALGLHGGLALGQDGDLDEAGHQGSSRRVISRSMRAMERCSCSTRWKAL